MSGPRVVEFGATPDGRPVRRYSIGGAGAVALSVLDLGATVCDLRMPAAPEARLVRAYGSAAEYLAPGAGYLGATVGRFANRIANAGFELDQVSYRLSANEGTTCLHGGVDGFHARTWRVTEADERSLVLELVSPDGDQGFPGELRVAVSYRVDEAGVAITYVATADRPTVVGLTNHSYFSLSGGTIDDHLLTVDADAFLPVDSASIPLGERRPVAGTPFDLGRPTVLGDRIRVADPAVIATAGIDHAFVLRGSGLRRAARLEHPATGRVLEVVTDQPSLQVYTANQLTGTRPDAGGRLLRQGDGICLETQRFPDAPNQPGLGDCVLRPGEQYRAETRWLLSRTEPVTA